MLEKKTKTIVLDVTVHQQKKEVTRGEDGEPQDRLLEQVTHFLTLMLQTHL